MKLVAQINTPGSFNLALYVSPKDQAYIRPAVMKSLNIRISIFVAAARTVDTSVTASARVR